VEFEIEVEQVVECLTRNGADRTLANIREYRVQQLTEQRRTYACRAVCPCRVR
jgi:hypothetical protein